MKERMSNDYFQINVMCENLKFDLFSRTNTVVINVSDMNTHDFVIILPVLKSVA